MQKPILVPRATTTAPAIVLPARPASPANVMKITNRSSAAVTNYPLQFGRPFVLGEIPHFPRVVLDGVAIPTQADVKNRHPDGSVKYAVIAAVVPNLPVATPVAVQFVDQMSGNNVPLATSDMLDPAYGFEAVMALAFPGGTFASASARKMLGAGDYKLWTSGPIAQTVEIADDSIARTYDCGNGDGFRPFRPRFYATFWRDLHKIQVRFVGENGLTTEIENLFYIAALSIWPDASACTIDLSGADGGKIHWALTNWTKTFWIGGEPEPKVDIDHNLAYLSQTKYLPNFDTSMKIPEATLAHKYISFNAMPSAPYDATWNAKGLWQSGMASPGARAEIGPYPEWAVDWLYSGDWRARKIALTMADLASAFPANLRESDPARRLSRDDAAGSGTGLGHAISVTDRETVCLFRTDLFNWNYTVVSDRVREIGPLSEKWTLDGAHQPAAFYPQYILTGDPYYLNQMYMWAGFTTARYTQAQRGPIGAEGGIKDELRGYGWVLRNRAEAAVAAPDSHPEKAYFSYLLDDALAELEGSFGITGTFYDSHPMRAYGVAKGNMLNGNGGPCSGQSPVLHNWESNGNPLNPAANARITANENSGIYQKGTVGSYTSPWMQYYVLYSLGRVKELGFAAGPLLNYTGKWLTDMILHSGNPDLMAVYQMPVEKNGGGFMSWQDILSQGLTANYLNTTLANVCKTPAGPDDYRTYVASGLAYLVEAGAPDAAAAWRWYKANVYNLVTNFNANPKWAILPRV